MKKARSSSLIERLVNGGGVAKKRGISKEQICVVVAHDRNGQILSQTAGKGRITAMEIDGVLGNILTPLLCYAQIQRPTIKNSLR